ncbi:formate/nitrite transporter family protein [Mesobacillus maritimus]|uniref:formate/nitrite transporter family protein n=1 Tax=Mesobacillus maritimus TaxID=1643336 RepID=UPI002040EF8E|nr:formate/nitrite transporter family protein [Mesobacillus maritimus]MCM3671991.1 formate/nitrite transporter family protein [Mesobacillus maritimus]
MAFHKPNKIAELTIEAGVTKAKLPFPQLLLLGFLGGAFISFGFLLDIRVIGNLPAEWGSLASFIGAAVFPVGLILVVLAGAELITGNMMSVSMAFYAKKIKLSDLLHNWVWITLANLVGALFVAYFFGHVVGLTETAPYLDKTVAIAQSKVDESFLQTFISAIGCNWLVCLAIWLAFGADDFAGKIAGIWFPIMAFVAIGFQHVVANMFVIPAAIFAGEVTWMEFLANVVPTFLGNVVGGAGFVGLIYFIVYQKKASHAQVLRKAS